MKHRYFLSLCFFLCMLSHCAWADIFRCTNADGKKVVTDRLTNECANKAVKVYANNGRLKNEIAAPLTVEEKQKISFDEERKRTERLAEESRKKEERYLQAHYRNEGDIESARKRSIDAINDRKRMATEQLRSLDQAISALQTEMKGAKKTSAEYDALRFRADGLAKTIEKNRFSITLDEQEIVRTNREFDETLLRYQIVISKSRNK